MSSDDSDVYIIDSPYEPPSSCSRQVGSCPEELTSSSRSSVSVPRVPAATISATASEVPLLRDAGTNTEEHVESEVSTLLHHGITSLLDTVVGKEFTDYVSMKCKKLKLENGAAGAVQCVRHALKRLRAVAEELPYPLADDVGIKVGVEMKNIHVEGAPQWLAELQQSALKSKELLSKVSALEFIAPSTSTTGISFAPIHLPLCAAATEHSDTSQPSSLPPTKNESERLRELEDEVRALQKTAAEARTVLKREGVESIIPLYDELLALRKTKRQAAARDAELTMAYLITQECSFRERVAKAERCRNRLLDEVSQRCCSSDGVGGVSALADEIEELIRLGGELGRLHEEYRKLTAVAGSADHVSTELQGNESQCAKGSGIKFLLEEAARKDEEISKLRLELEEQSNQACQWRQRYEMAIKAMEKPQGSPLFSSLLEDVKERLSKAAAMQNSALCRLFGWELCELRDSLVTITPLGSSEKRITVPISDVARDERSAMAISIVLAKKMLEGREALLESLQDDKPQTCEGGGLEREGEGGNIKKTKSPGSGVGVPTPTPATEVGLDDGMTDAFAVHEGSGVAGESEGAEEDSAQVQDKEMAHEEVRVGSDVPEEAALFYSSGLWEE